MDQDIADNTDLGDAGKKALQAERDARKQAETAKTTAEQALAEAQTKLQAAEAATTAKDQEWTTKLADADAKAKADLEAANADNLKLKVALNVGIPEPLLGSLQGTNKDELKASAENLKQFLAPKAPAPDPTQGGAGSGDGDNLAGLSGRELMTASINID